MSKRIKRRQEAEARRTFDYSRTVLTNRIYAKGMIHAVGVPHDVWSTCTPPAGYPSDWVDEHYQLIHGQDYQDLAMNNSHPLYSMTYFFRDEDIAIAFKMRWG